MTKLTGLAPMLAARDLGETMRFYETLGFSCQGTFEVDGDAVWCSLERDGIRLMFTWEQPHAHDGDEPHSHDPALAGTLYFYCEDIDELSAELQGKAPVEMDLADREYGMRDFAISDPNGYLLSFGGHLPA